MKRSVKKPRFFLVIHLVIEFFSDLFDRIFSGSKGSVPYSNGSLSPVTEDLARVDWTAKDAMVGTVRNREQLHYNLSHNCYYVPARFLQSDQPSIAYIALHERDEADIPCIVRIGRVKTVERVERRTIPVTMRKETDPKEPYIYFTVEEWNPLPHRILIRDTARGKPLFTGRFLLEHCRSSYELFVISSQEDYRLLEGIYALLCPNDEDSLSCNITETRRLTLHKGILSLTNLNGDLLCKISLKAYAASPRSSFLYLKKHLT